MQNQDILNIKTRALEDIAVSKNYGELFDVEKKYLGKKGELNAILKGLKDLPEAERRETGNVANIVKKEIFIALENKRSELNSANFDFERKKSTLPCPGKKSG